MASARPEIHRRDPAGASKAKAGRSLALDVALNVVRMLYNCLMTFIVTT